MSLAPGDRLRPYATVSALGAGWMREVYRGRDSKLNRDVAIKVLPDLFAHGRYPAALNFGDCLAYGATAAAGDSLLYVGEEFARTDIPSAG